MPEEKRIDVGETKKAVARSSSPRGGWLCPKFSQQKDLVFIPMESENKSDFDQLQSAKPAEMNNSDQEQCHRKMG